MTKCGRAQEFRCPHQDDVAGRSVYLPGIASRAVIAYEESSPTANDEDAHQVDVGQMVSMRRDTQGVLLILLQGHIIQVEPGLERVDIQLPQCAVQERLESISEPDEPAIPWKGVAESQLLANDAAALAGRFCQLFSPHLPGRKAEIGVGLRVRVQVIVDSLFQVSFTIK